MTTLPFCLPAAIQRPVGSNLAKRAVAKREVWIADGWVIWNGSVVLGVCALVVCVCVG